MQHNKTVVRRWLDAGNVKADLTGSHQDSRLLEKELIAEHWASRDDLGVLRQLGAR